MKVLIAGYGYVGSALGEQLSKEGHTVVALSRSLPQSLSQPPSPSMPQSLLAESSQGEAVQGYQEAQWYQGDVTSLASLAELPRDIDQIVYAVAAKERSLLAYQNAYVTGVKHLKAELPGARFVFVSSTAVYAQEDGDRVTCESPATANGFAAEQLREGERLCLLRSQQDPLASPFANNHVVVRASGIYGPGRTRFVDSLVDRELGEEERSVFTNRIHRDDLARALHFLLLRSELSGTFLASDPAPASVGEIQDYARARLKKATRGQNAETQASSASVRARKNRFFEPTRLLRAGFSFTYPSFREGYDSILSNAAST